MTTSVTRLEESPLIKEMYLHFGIAAHYGQNLEKELCLLLYFPALDGQQTLDEHIVEDVYDRLSKQELGKLLDKLRKHFKVDPGFDLRLETARKKRNYLIHHFFGENAQKLYDQSLLPSLIQELKDIATLLAEAVMTIRPFNEKLRHRAQSAKALNERHS